MHSYGVYGNIKMNASKSLQTALVDFRRMFIFAIPRHAR